VASKHSAAELVRGIRSRRAWSQRELAEAADTAQSVVGRIEAGLTSPTVDTLERLLHAAGFELRLECSPRHIVDPVVEAYKPGVDRTLLVENLRKTPHERFLTLLAMRRFALNVRGAGETARRVAEPQRPYGEPSDE
jgi:transcriptional regulator with XRE-family HTH domain